MDACARRRPTRPIPLMFGNFPVIPYQAFDIASLSFENSGR